MWRAVCPTARIDRCSNTLIYADAAIRGLIGSVREKLDALRARGFWLTDRHYEQILREAGEL